MRVVYQLHESGHWIATVSVVRGCHTYGLFSRSNPASARRPLLNTRVSAWRGARREEAGAECCQQRQLALTLSGRHLRNETQGTVRIDFRPQDRVETRERLASIRTVGQDLACVLAKEPGTGLVEVESVCRERLAFVAKKPILVAGVGVVTQEHPDVGGVLAGSSVSSVVLCPDLQKGQGR